MEWIIERINLDPDAFSCAIIIAILLVFMVVTVAIWAVWRVAYIKLWRWNRRKKSPPVGQNQTRGETDITPNIISDSIENVNRRFLG